MLSGFLKPNGDWIPFECYQHEPWAVSECGRLKISYTVSVTDMLADRGYLQISLGRAFFTLRNDNLIKLTAKQLDFLIVYIDEMESNAKRMLVQFYGIIFPDMSKPDYTNLNVPTF